MSNADSFHKSRVKKQLIQALRLFDKSIKIEKELPTELVYEDAVYRYPDLMFLGEDGEIYIIEFQTGKIKKDQLYRFTTYGAITAQKYRKKVNIIIIYTEKVETDICHDEGSIKFMPIAYSFKDIDGEKIFKRLTNKISNNEKFTKSEYDEWEFLPLFQLKLSAKEVLWETVKLTNELKGISQEDIDHIKTGQALLLHWLFKDYNEIKDIMDVIRMKTSVFHEIYDEGIEKGKVEGRKEGILEGKIEGKLEEKLDTARKMLELNLSIEDIVKVTGLSKKEIDDL